MDTSTTALRALAEKLVALERKRTSGSSAQSSLEVFLAVRGALSRLAGPEGFTALMRRAVALAQKDVPELASVRVLTDGSIEGLEDVLQGPAGGEADPGVAILTQLLSLLVTFIGESLTLRLLKQLWPEAFPK